VEIREPAWAVGARRYVMSATMERIAVGDAELEVDDQGSGEPVILIHGSGPADSFLPVAIEPAVRDHYRVVRYHRRGSAGSSPVHGPIAIARQAADCRALLGALGLTKAHVVGHSYGAAVALQLALDAPEAVRTLALFELAIPSVPSGQEFTDAAAPIIEQYMSGDRVGAAHGFLALVDGPDWREEISRTVPGGPAQAEKDVATLFECELPSILEWRFGPEEATRIQQPVLYLLGTESHVMLAESEALLGTWLPRMEHDILPGANHLMQMRHPAEAAARMVAFLERHPVSG
jgi:pimeloyl-ACP methyl ester carboxylesterase